jgi:hypothetical protein
VTLLVSTTPSGNSDLAGLAKPRHAVLDPDRPGRLAGDDEVHAARAHHHVGGLGVAQLVGADHRPVLLGQRQQHPVGALVGVTLAGLGLGVARRASGKFDPRLHDRYTGRSTREFICCSVLLFISSLLD